ncbi:MAG: site-specific integrase [Thiotrichales bacterium]|nr:site-specific integrase [Thiotrichales bacterium]
MSIRLLDEMRDLMRRRHYPIHTERAYRDWVRRYARFHNMQSRDDLRHGEGKIEAFLTCLAGDRQVAASTQNQAMNALVFLYKHVLKQPLSGVINADRARWKVKHTRRPDPRGDGSRVGRCTSLSPSIVFSRLASGRPWRVGP